MINLFLIRGKSNCHCSNYENNFNLLLLNKRLSGLRNVILKFNDSFFNNINGAKVLNMQRNAHRQTYLKENFNNFQFNMMSRTSVKNLLRLEAQNAKWHFILTLFPPHFIVKAITFVN